MLAEGKDNKGEPMDTQLTITEPQEHAPKTALADLRSHALAVPVDVMQVALQDYAERRDMFREWLLQQLTEGLHYGYVPGTEPKFDNSGNMISRQWDKRTSGFKEVKISPKSWQAKRCLYKAGAEFIVDLMGVRAEYEADVAAWQQLGSVPGNFVIKCKLFSRATGELVGEGIGARKVGTKGGDENNAVKMAQKAAMVAAVLNSYGLSDLFTQDMEEKPKYENPDAKADAPKTETRSNRKSHPEGVTAKQVGDAVTEWKTFANDDSFDAWKVFVLKETGRMFNPKQSTEWTLADLRAVHAAIQREQGVPADTSIPF